MCPYCRSRHKRLRTVNRRMRMMAPSRNLTWQKQVMNDHICLCLVKTIVAQRNDTLRCMQFSMEREKMLICWFDVSCEMATYSFYCLLTECHWQTEQARATVTKKKHFWQPDNGPITKGILLSLKVQTIVCCMVNFVYVRLLVSTGIGRTLCSQKTENRESPKWWQQMYMLGLLIWWREHLTNCSDKRSRIDVNSTAEWSMPQLGYSACFSIMCTR